ncbi:hypothetical protein [Halomonas caseinilytica]|uniref:Uncharacterized protein n=1 Tax=Halomonas caseinilytica TaxID=438744 RepID=A0A1M6T8D9_9GAMM|nr:hypothetical protein [Halomonas caseinilytica]SHK53210.1 hypothetical protein SAMN05192556_103249 [Halomonas caseinilytica]
MTTDRRSLAQQAGMLCNLPAFGLYLDARARRDKGMTREQLPDGTHNAEDAADAVRRACGVESRVDLDRNEQAAAMYKRIVADFGRWKRRSES